MHQKGTSKGVQEEGRFKEKKRTLIVNIPNHPRPSELLRLKPKFSRHSTPRFHISIIFSIFFPPAQGSAWIHLDHLVSIPRAGAHLLVRTVFDVGVVFMACDLSAIGMASGGFMG